VPTQYSANVKIGDNIYIGEVAVMHLSYRVLWDKGSTLDLLIYDPNCEYHRLLENLGGSPTPPIEFQLEYESSRGHTYKNKGTKHTLYMVKAGQVTTPEGLCLRIRAVDKGSIALRETVLNHTAPGVKASKFVEALCGKVNIQAQIPNTGDNASTHRAMRVKPIDAIRYELDRVLGASGRPISIQFDDRTDKQRLMGYEELYELDTALLADCLTGGSYSYGVGVADNGGTPMAYGNAIYHWEMDQDYRPAIWGHQVSVNHLTSKGEEVIGELKAKLAAKLGIQGDVLKQGGSRLAIPMAGQDSATTDDYYAKAVMTNALFQTEMSITRGWVLVDSDYRAYDSPEILNRKHVIIAITGAMNQASKNAIIPKKSVVMGFEHRLNRKSAYTRLHLRRGT
jgi:hypothetical protein